MSNMAFSKFITIKESTIMFSQPDSNSVKKAILRKYSPVEVVYTKNDWLKVRYATGEMGWILEAVTSNTAQHVVTQKALVARQEPSSSSPSAFAIKDQVILKIYPNEASGNWVKVSPLNQENLSGYIPAHFLWGYDLDL